MSHEVVAEWSKLDEDVSFLIINDKFTIVLQQRILLKIIQNQT